jgi:hypothetical protein
MTGKIRWAKKNVGSFDTTSIAFIETVGIKDIRVDIAIEIDKMSV